MIIKIAITILIMIITIIMYVVMYAYVWLIIMYGCPRILTLGKQQES